MTSISRQLGEWVANLRYEDLPPEVVDRARGVTLQALTSALLGFEREETRQALALMREEEGGATGGTVLVDGSSFTKGGAAFINSEMTFAGGKWDTFRMLTHPGCAIIPAALAAAEANDASGRDVLVGIVAGYEVMERLAADFIPTLMSRGFHAGPVFAIFGAAVAAAKVGGLDAEQVHGAIAQCVNLAAGNLEGARSGGRALREGGAVRNALLAVALARNGVKGGETTLEGEAGFYHSYIGNNLGSLTYSFTGDTKASFDAITEGLGSKWLFLETLYRIYTTSGYNIAHIDVTAALCSEHDLKPDDIHRIEATVNWLETLYPSPAFPSRILDRDPRPDIQHYYVAYGVVERGYSLLKDRARNLGEPDRPEVLELMQRVKIIPSHRQPLFAPSITIFTRDGHAHTKHATGREFIFSFDELAQRIAGVKPGLPIPPEQYDELTAACARLEDLAQARRLIDLTLSPARDANS